MHTLWSCLREFRMVSGFSSKLMFQMETSSGITKYGSFVHLARLIVGFLFCFFNIYRFVWEAGAVKPGQIQDGC